MNDPQQQFAGDWRRVFGALANEETRLFYAQRLLGLESDLRPERQVKAQANLSNAGLLDVKGQVDGDIFGRILTQGTKAEPRVGTARYFDGEGRIERYPKKHEERVELLRLVAGKVLGHGQVLSEAELTVKLEKFADDPVLLRRYLVDYGVLLRQTDGSVYRLADGSD